MSDMRAGLDPVHLYGYLTKAREKLLGWVRPLTMEQYTQEFPFGLKTLRDTLVEIPQAEWAYVRRLQGESVPAWEERPFAPFLRTEFAPFEAALRAQAEETATALGEISDWARPVEYPGVFKGKPLRIRTTTGGIAAQLLFHEIHHRAQAMAMLRQLGVPAQDLDYAYLMYAWTPIPA